METAFGKDGAAAMIVHGDLCARILHTGYIRLSDRLALQQDAHKLDLFIARQELH